MTPKNLNLMGILRALARGSVHSHSPLPRPSSGERSDAAFSRRPGEGADHMAVEIATPQNAPCRADAPSPEQRLKGVLDLSPNEIGREVTTAFTVGDKTQTRQQSTPLTFSHKPFGHRRWILAALIVLMGGAAFAQRGYWGRRNRSLPTDRNGVPTWEVDPRFPQDSFTFARIEYDSYGGRGRGGGGCWTDYPDSDLNFSLRLQQLTSLKVNPDPVVIRLTDDELFDYPFIYIIEPGGLVFSEEEVKALRKYCLNGGFLMVDDFWGDSQYENMRSELKRVFPDRDPFEVPLEHEIFHIVYDLKEKPQVPAINSARRRADGSVGSWEWSRDGSDTSVPHYRAITDDEDRIMVFICHNTDLGDGWEREGEDQWYFDEFSVKKAYPMGINIVTYAMTH